MGCGKMIDKKRKENPLMGNSYAQVRWNEIGIELLKDIEACQELSMGGVSTEKLGFKAYCLVCEKFTPTERVCGEMQGVRKDSRG